MRESDGRCDGQSTVHEAIEWPQIIRSDGLALAYVQYSTLTASYGRAVTVTIRLIDCDALNTGLTVSSMADSQQGVQAENKTQPHKMQRTNLPKISGIA